MGFLDIENRGSGYIGPIGENWRISYNTSPQVLGMESGKLGSLSFSARCDGTSKFTIDNYLSVKHYFDNQTGRWLSTFDVNVRSVSTNDEFGSFTTTSKLSQLDVRRRSSANPSGIYQRTIKPPSGKSYTVNSIDYTTPPMASVYDVAVSSDYIYVLAAGSHGGEVVHRFGIDGYWFAMWPVYSDSSDLASPESRYISVVGTTVYIAQVAQRRIKKFDGWSGTFQTQWGSSGTGNSQFNTISAIAANSSAIYVADSVLGRIQRFNSSGTYLGQFGTQGTTDSEQIFDRPNSLYARPGDESVFVGDMKARVREYTPAGGWVSNAFGGYDFFVGGVVGPFAANSRIGVTYDSLGNAYCAQDGIVYKFSHDRTVNLNGSWQDGARLTHTFPYDGVWNINASETQGILHGVGADGMSIKQYAGSTTSVQAYILYYLALAVPDFPCRLLLLNAGPGGSVDIPEWEMSVWQALNELCAATGNALSAFDDRVDFFSRTNRGTFELPKNAAIEPVEIDSRTSGRTVEVTNHNARRTAKPEVMYSSVRDGNKTFSADIATLDHVTVSQDTYPEYLIQPQPQGAQVNPFSNPSVETNLNNLGYYVPSPGTGTLTRQVNASFAQWGDAFARLQFTSAVSGAYSYISNQVDVLPGAVYDFQAYGRISGSAQKLQMWVSWRNSAGQSVGWAAGQSTTVTSSAWVPLTLNQPAVAPPSASFAYVQVRTALDGRAWLSGEYLYADMWSDGSPLLAGNPNPVANPGRYMVYDSDNLLVDPYKWSSYGGRIDAQRGKNPGTIELTIYGPGLEIPGTKAPYSIRSLNGDGSLSIMGAGIITAPEVISIGTGLTEKTTSREVAQSVDSVHAWTAKVAWDEAGWIAYRSSLSQSLKVHMRISSNPPWLDDGSGLGGTSTLIGRLVRYGDALYMIESVEASASTITLELTLHTPWGYVNGVAGDVRPETIWGGSLAGDFDGFWGGYTSQDFHIAPLLNPFGV